MLSAAEMERAAGWLADAELPLDVVKAPVRSKPKAKTKAEAHSVAPASASASVYDILTDLTSDRDRIHRTHQLRLIATFRDRIRLALSDVLIGTGCCPVPPLIAIICSYAVLPTFAVTTITGVGMDAVSTLQTRGWSADGKRAEPTPRFSTGERVKVMTDNGMTYDATISCEVRSLSTDVVTRVGSTTDYYEQQMTSAIGPVADAATAWIGKPSDIEFAHWSHAKGKAESAAKANDMSTQNSVATDAKGTGTGTGTGTRKGGSGYADASNREVSYHVIWDDQTRSEIAETSIAPSLFGGRYSPTPLKLYRPTECVLWRPALSTGCDDTFIVYCDSNPKTIAAVNLRTCKRTRCNG